MLAVFAAAAFADDLPIARKALRDGLWEIARSHAAGSDSDEARLITVESYAREGNWTGLLSALRSWNFPAAEPFVYYRALALARSGEAQAAEGLLKKTVFSDPVFSTLALRLRACIAAQEGKGSDALELTRRLPAGSVDEDSRMFMASLLSATGDRPGAEEIWRGVVAAGTNSSERAFVVAAVSLGDASSVTAAVSRAVSADMKRLSGFALARRMLRSAQTLDEGAAAVRRIVREKPDADGAKEAFSAMVDAFVGAGRFQEAVDVCRETFDIWPDTVNSFPLNGDLGWALSRLGRADEALEAYSRAEKNARSDAERAEAIVRQGDVLASSGRSEAALDRYRLVLERYPETEPAGKVKEVVRLRELENRGRDLFRVYRYEEAQEIFRKIGTEDPSRKPRMDFYEVLTLYGQGLDTEAEKKAADIAANSPDAAIRADAELWLGKFLYNRSRWSESGKRFIAYAEAAPSSPAASDALVWAARSAFAENEFQRAVDIVTDLARRYPKSAACSRGLLVQGESLIELARFDEAVLVLERVAMAAETEAGDRLRAKLLGADALFAMGADNPLRYQEALEAYRGVRAGESLDYSARIAVSYKIAKTMEKLKRIDDAVECYYTEVVLAYRDGRLKGLKYDDDAKAAFSRAAFRLADEYESRGRALQAANILELVEKSDVPAAVEARRRIERIKMKGNFL